MCSDVLHIVLDPLVGIWCMVDWFQESGNQWPVGWEPLCDNLVQSTGCIVILLIFGWILHELSCTEPVLGSPLRLSTLYSSCSMWELGKAKYIPITGAWLPFLFVSSAAGDWIRTVLLIDKCSILIDIPRPTLYSLEKEKRQETAPQASSLSRLDPATRWNWVPSAQSHCRW